MLKISYFKSMKDTKRWTRCSFRIEKKEHSEIRSV